MMLDAGTRSRAENVLAIILRAVRAELAGNPHVSVADVDDYVDRYRGALIDAVAEHVLGAGPARPTGKASGYIVEDAPPGPITDERQRAEANLLAMTIMARVRWGTAREAADLATLHAADRAAIKRYSGWGGVGIKRYAARFPAGFPVPEARGLVHEYYTPARVWEAVADMLYPWKDRLPRGGDGLLSALEPSAGIGRALAAFGPVPEGGYRDSGARMPHGSAGWDLDWTALEASAVSARLLRATYPAAHVVEGYAEAWLARSTEQFGLVVANPPYGARGEGRELDAAAFKTAQAYVYFTLRTAERLAKGGIGVYIIPTGLMTSRTTQFQTVRRELLRRAHLLGAFRLPSVPPNNPDGSPGNVADVAYEQFVVDVVIVQGRGGLADAPPEADLAVIDGDYYEQHPSHVLGIVLQTGDDNADSPIVGKVRRGMQIMGRFTGFPAWTPRPFVEVEVRGFASKAKVRGGLTRDAVVATLPADAPARLHAAVGLGARVDAYLAAVAKGKDTESAGRAELARDLQTWATSYGVPGRDEAVRELAGSNVAARRFLSVWDGARLLGSLLQPGPAPTFTGARTLPELADWMFRQGGGLPLPLHELASAAADAGLGKVDEVRVWADLWPLGWRLDEQGGKGTQGPVIEPRQHYVTGFLWPKLDRARASKWPMAREQARELQEAIGWVGGSTLINQTAPNQPWIPLEIIGAFARHGTQRHRTGGWSGPTWAHAPSGDKGQPVPVVVGWPNAEMERNNGLTSFKGISYTVFENTEGGRHKDVSQSMLCFLGYLNSDNHLWRPPVEQYRTEAGTDVRVPVEQTRRLQETEWREAWVEWLQANDKQMEALELAYNRELRGYVPPVWSQEPLQIARWNNGITLHPYQNAGARKLLANRSGLLAFDVGLGKTFTGIATLAKARQEGWAKRPVIVVPPTICWKWYRDLCDPNPKKGCLPDYRVVVIGSNRTIAKSGPRKGRLIAQNDTPEERAAKWTAFQAGAYDVAVVTYQALARQQIDREFVAGYVAKTVAIRRAITLALEQADAEEEAGSKKKPKAKRSERGEADMHERARAWVGDKLSLPKGWAYDPGIDWHQLGVDFLMVDEAQNFKNLFYSSREGAADKAASKRAWALDFRCASVREHSGGAGVVLLSATPMKNAATEFYNLLHLVNPKVWQQVGLEDPESFVSQFAEIDERDVEQGDGSKKKQMVVTGFNHIEALKGVVYRWAEFKNAQQVGMKLPAVQTTMHVANATDAQRAKFALIYAELADITERIKKAAHLEGAKRVAVMRALMEKKQGCNARLYLTALHPSLTGGGQQPEDGPKLVHAVKTIMGVGDFNGPPLDPSTAEGWASYLAAARDAGVIRTVPTTCSVATEDEPETFCLNCGHIVFVENPSVHHHMKTLLVRAGLDPSRIALMNATDSPDLEQRAQIAVDFNGVGTPSDEEYTPPKYDVVIANSVAYEGIDLQRRTCAIHHLDVPWEPATLQQRNGRGVRQGAKFKDIGIHFYFVAKSSEKHRLGKIERKRGIMLALYDEGAVATNTVQADIVDAEDDDAAGGFSAYCPAEYLEAMAADVKESAAAAVKAAEDKARAVANGVLRDAIQARRRWLNARDDDPERAARLEKDYRDLETRIGTFPAKLWAAPWHRLAHYALEAGEAWVPPHGAPVVAGTFLTLATEEHGMDGFTELRPVFSKRPEGQEWDMLVTQANGDGATGVLLVGAPRLAALPTAAIVQAASYEPLDADDYAARFPKYLPFRRLASWSGEVWAKHGRVWAESLWPRFLAEVASERQWPSETLPARVGGGLALAPQGQYVNVSALYPPTDDGWALFLADARAQKAVSYSALKPVTLAWWGREMPLGVVGADLKAQHGA